MMRATVSHWRLLGLLLIVLILGAGLPGQAAYTKLYRCTNTTGEDQAYLRVINNALEVITGYTADPTAWSPPVVSNILYGGVYCTKLKFGDLDPPVVTPDNYAQIGWRTADNNCRLRDLRWVTPYGKPFLVVDPEQLGGVPGGGEVQYVDGEYVWLLINDTGAAINLSDVSVQVLDEAPPLPVLMQMAWPAMMRTLQAGETPPHPDIVATRVATVIGEHIQPLRAAVAAAQDAGHVSEAHEQGLLGQLEEAEAALQAGQASYSTDPQQAEADWADAATAATEFGSLVAEIDAKQPILFQPSSWPHWTAIAYGKVNDDGIVTGYCKPTSDTHYAFLWDSRELGDAGFVDLHGVALSDLGLPSYYLTTARDINSEGYVVGAAFAYYGGPSRAVLWEPDGEGGYTAVAVPPPTGYTECELHGINDLGQIAAWARNNAGVLRTLLYQIVEGGVVLVQDLGHNRIGATDINNAGQIGGMYWTGSVYKPFRWDPPEVTGGEPRLIVEQTGGYWSHARVQEISDDGYMVGDDYVKGWAWLNDNQATPIPLSADQRHKALGVNSLGDVVGYEWGNRGVAWELHSPGYPGRSLHPSAWLQSVPHDVNEVREVAGWCQLAAGGPVYAYIAGLDVLPYLLPEGMAQQWLAAADEAIAAIDWLPGPGEALAEELPPPEDPPPPPPPPDPEQPPYTYTDWGDMQEDPEPSLPPDAYTAFVVPDDDNEPNETLVLTTRLSFPTAGTSAMRTAQAGDYVLECVEMYTPGDEGVVGSDTTKPVIESASISPDQLWPPNHKMVDMAFDVQVSDVDDDGGERPASWYIESVSSSQPEDGKHAPDWLIDPEDQRSLELRAERDGKDRDGRTYTVVIRAIDQGGNLSDPHSLQVLVPHDRGRRGGGKIASLAALPAGGGVEVVFTLSSEAQVEVEVLNIAGRCVRTIVADRECEAGINSLAWNCRSDRGVMVPSGTYLVRVTARSDDGEQASRLCTVTLRR